MDDLMELLKGPGLVLRRAKNQYGEDIAADILSFRHGRWYLSQIACWSSADLGLGVCRCVSHDPVIRWEIDQSQAIDRICEYLAQQIAERQIAAEE